MYFYLIIFHVKCNSTSASPSKRKSSTSVSLTESLNTQIAFWSHNVLQHLSHISGFSIFLVLILFTAQFLGLGGGCM